MIEVLEAYDESKYKIYGFTPEEYTRLQDCVTNQKDPGSIDTFGFIEKINAPYAIDVTCREYGEDGWFADWDVYELGQDDYGYNDDLDGGAMDVSLSYDEQVEWLIAKLEEVLARHLKFDD